MAPRRLGHPPCDAHSSTAEPPLLHALIGHYVRLRWDVQDARIAMANRAGAARRDGLTEEWLQPLNAAVHEMAAVERGVDRQLEHLARQHPLRRWVEAAPGIGLVGFARLVAVTD